MNKYTRRKLKRRQKTQQLLAPYQSFSLVYRVIYLYKAFVLAIKGLRWKYAIQKYMANLFSNLGLANYNLLNGNDIRKGFIVFNRYDRGKLRIISSIHFEERVIQKAFCLYSLGPILFHNVIYDNAASQKDKGIHFALHRTTVQLGRYYRRYENDGYVLTIDFKSYFASILHDKAKENCFKTVIDDELRGLLGNFIDAFGDKGLGLGSEASQLVAITYLNPLDHYIKDQLGFKYYARYMDALWLLAPDKSVLISTLNKLRKFLEPYGVSFNEKKTNIHKLSQGFIFLRTHFYLTKTGKIIRKPDRRGITHERHRLRKQFKLFKLGKLSYKAIWQSFQSWKGSMKGKTARRTLYSMSCYFNKLFSQYFVFK